MRLPEKTARSWPGGEVRTPAAEHRAEEHEDFYPHLGAGATAAEGSSTGARSR